MDEDLVRKKMEEVLEVVSSDISSLRTGKANAGTVSDLSILVYGGAQKLKINELATVSVQDENTLIIDPWDKSIIGEIKKGIDSANIGLAPNIDGEIIRINISPMTSEDRQKFVKLLSSKLENGKIMIRQVRGEFKKGIEKMFDEKELSEDEKFAEEKKLQNITDEFIKKIEELGDKKRQEILSV